MRPTLPPPAQYRPWQKGYYDVSPNLKPLGADFGNGSADAHFAQLDSDFDRYRKNRLEAYAEDRSKYWATTELPENLLQTTYDALATRLANDHPDHFAYDGQTFQSNLTNEKIRFGPDQSLKTGNLPTAIDHPLEALVWQIQADFALVHRAEDGSDRIVSILVTAPSHWRPRDKLGLSFFQSHQVVPGFDKINAQAAKMVDAMISKGPFIRFVWGIDSDDRLNHHPDPPPNQDPQRWKGRNFESGDLYVRYERQTLLGIPEADASIFLIHAKTLPAKTLSQEDRAQLKSAVESMSPEALAYKGFSAGKEHLIKRL